MDSASTDDRSAADGLNLQDVDGARMYLLRRQRAAQLHKRIWDPTLFGASLARFEEAIRRDERRRVGDAARFTPIEYSGQFPPDLERACITTVWTRFAAITGVPGPAPEMAGA